MKDSSDRSPARLRLSIILSDLCGEYSPAVSGSQPEQPVPTTDPSHDTVESDKPTSRLHRRKRKPRIPSDLTIGEIIDRSSHAGFGFMLGFLSLISIPFFGLSTPFGLAIAFGASQMIIGRSRPWLPAWVRRHRVSLKTLQWISTKLTRWTAGLERWVRPRFTVAVHGPFWAICGLAIAIQGLGLALPLPIPGSNWIFIFPVIVYAVGLLENDGLLIIICHVVTAVEILLGIWAWDAVWGAVMSALHRFS